MTCTYIKINMTHTHSTHAERHGQTQITDIYFFKKEIIISTFLVCMDVSSECMSVYCMWTWDLWRPKGGITWNWNYR